MNLIFAVLNVSLLVVAVAVYIRGRRRLKALSQTTSAFEQALAARLSRKPRETGEARVIDLQRWKLDRASVGTGTSS